MVALIGTVVKENDTITKVVVEDLVYLPLLESTPDVCRWDTKDLAQLMIAVQPLAVVGTLHSHPACDVVALSPQDVAVAEAYGEIISGIFTWWQPEGGRKRSRVDWYSGVKAVNVKNTTNLRPTE